MPNKTIAAIEISQLAIYPVKSCAQLRVFSVNVDNFGLHMDRRWMVVDEQGKFLTQRQLARMCLIGVALTETGAILSAPDMMPCIVTVSNLNQRQSVSIWSDQCNGLDCGDVVADWLSKFLQQVCRLIYFPEDEFRQVDLDFAQQGERTAFSDGFPFLLISEASLQDLNERIQKSESQRSLPALEMRRFRPNIVVKGCEAFAEDQWKKIQIGNIILRVVKPCKRCIIPTIDPNTGIKGDEPLKTLRTYRKQDKKILFGQNIIAENTGEFAVGMPVKILE